eukprot:gene29948-37384_t
MNGYALPFMHLMCYGVIKKFVNVLRQKYTDARDTCYFSEAQRSQLQANGKELECTQDMHRGYLDVVQYAGNYTMEDFLNFILIFSPMGNDIAARRDARKAAATDMWDVAVILQQQAPTRMMTLNLRLAVVHYLAPQEEEIGAVSNAIELYLERMLFVTKSVVPAPITGAAMDTHMGNASLLRDTRKLWGEHMDDNHEGCDLCVCKAMLSNGKKCDGKRFMRDDGRQMAEVGHKTAIDLAPVKAFWTYLDADEPARAKMMGFKTHSDYRFCFNCKFVGNN